MSGRMTPMSEIEEKIRTMDLKEAYNFMLTEDSIKQSVKRKARFGFLKNPLDIHDYFEGGMIMKWKKGIIKHRGSRYKMEDIHTDMEKRAEIIKKALLQIYGDQDFMKSR